MRKAEGKEKACKILDRIHEFHLPQGDTDFLEFFFASICWVEKTDDAKNNISCINFINSIQIKKQRLLDSPCLPVLFTLSHCGPCMTMHIFAFSISIYVIEI